MVDRSGHWTNSKEVTDFLALSPNPKRLDSASIRDLYIEKGLSSAKIANLVGLSKAAVLSRLHDLGIRRETLDSLSKGKSRPPSRAPYGQRIVDGHLVEDRREMKIARLIIELRERRALGWVEVAERLNRDGLRTRCGLPWQVGTARAVFARWSGKI